MKARKRGTMRVGVNKQHKADRKMKVRMNTERRQGTRSTAGQKKQLVRNTKGNSRTSTRQLRSEDKVQGSEKKVSKTMDLKRKAMDKKKGRDKKHGIIPTKGARSVKLTMAKGRMAAEKAQMATKWNKNSELKKRAVEEERRKKKFEQDVMREIDRMKSQEKDEHSKRPSSSGVITRHVRQCLLQSKRKEEVKQAAKSQKTSQVGEGTGENSVEKEEELSLKVMASQLDSEDQTLRLEAATSLRGHVVANFSDTGIQQVIDLGVVPKLARFLKDKKKTKFHYEACWILNNIAASKSAHTKVVFDTGVLPTLLSMASVKNDGQTVEFDLREIAIAALSNLAGDCIDYRDKIFESGIIPALADILKNSDMPKTIHATIDLVVNFARNHESYYNIDKLTPIFELLKKHLQNPVDGINRDACWAVTKIGNHPRGFVEEFSEVGPNSICAILVKLCSDPLSAVPLIEAAVTALGTIASGVDVMTWAPVKNGALSAFRKLLHDERAMISKRCLFAISNITAGMREQIQAVIDADLIPMVLKILSQAKMETKNNAMWVIKNALEGGSVAQCRYIADQGAIFPICSCLSDPDVEIFGGAVTALQIILSPRVTNADLSNGSDKKSYAQIVRDCGGVKKLEALKAAQQEAQLHAKICLMLDDYL